ncbi:carbohydrate kinase family protein [Cellulomonas bogoriensis]|uniref:Ribokinase n=1 Tax=Cellulomonas bogoriensis 69B4 = DSM 16987 TaxID=1386082 RepID=A0A0A0C3F8_9CELL|nr:carbohydrate kinase [Cellulomonas bogoriensis]KGM13904.1 ribokinase [Cellulomonas bogoriensis 69B4 = DSM 16987]
MARPEDRTTEPEEPFEAPDGPPTPGHLDPPSGTTGTAVAEGHLDPATEPRTEAVIDQSERGALVVGEALVDVVRAPDGTVAEHPGGSPANVALGLARLGRRVALLTWLGRDEHGTRVTAHLTGNGVDVVRGSESAPRTSTATATLDDAGIARYEFDVTWEVAERWASPAAPPLVVHTGSIAAVLEPGGRDVAHILAAHRESATLTYDPNLRPSLMPEAEVTRPVVEELVGAVDVVKVSDEDLAWLQPGADPLEIARRWAASGPAVVIVTRGGEGATAVTSAGHVVDVAAEPVEIADTVGAGDSFMSGLVDGLWSAGLLGAAQRTALHAVDAEVLRGVLRRCAEIAAVTVSRPGANPPTRDELGTD